MSAQKDHASIGRLAGCGLAGGLIGAILPPMVGLGSNLFFREFLVLIIGAIALVAGPVLGIVVGMTIYGWQPIAGAANIAAFVLPATVSFTVWGAIERSGDRCDPGARLQLWDAESGRATWTVDSNLEILVAVSRSGDTFATAGPAPGARILDPSARVPSVKVRDTASGAVRRAIELDSATDATSIRVSSNFESAVARRLVENRWECAVWDLRAGRIVRSNGETGCWPVGVAPGGAAVIGVVTEIGAAEHAVWWDPETDLRHPLPFVLGNLNSLSADGTRFGGTGADNHYSLFDTATGDEVIRLEKPKGVAPSARAGLNGAVFSDDGQTFAAVNQGDDIWLDGNVGIWNLRTGALTQQINVRTGVLALSPSGDRLLTSEVRTERLKLWQIPGGRLLRTFPVGAWRGGMAFLADGKHFITGWRC